MLTDPIADYLTRVRNAIAVRKKVVDIPHSRLKESISKVLEENGYIRAYKVVEVGQFKQIKIALKYDQLSKRSAITKLTRVSRPGLRQYSDVDSIPRVLNGLGIAILSTSKGVMTGKHAVVENVGGEVLCYIY